MKIKFFPEIFKELTISNLVVGVIEDYQLSQWYLADLYSR